MHVPRGWKTYWAAVSVHFFDINVGSIESVETSPVLISRFQKVPSTDSPSACEIFADLNGHRNFHNCQYLLNDPEIGFLKLFVLKIGRIQEDIQFQSIGTGLFHFSGKMNPVFI